MFELVHLRDELHTIRDTDSGETFHPVVGPMAEAEAIHIAPLRLEKRLGEGSDFIVWDVGLGAGANAVAFIEKLARITLRFHCGMVSFDRTLEPLRFALEHAEALQYPLAWKTSLRDLADTHLTRITFSSGAVLDWRLQLGDFTAFPEAPAPDGIIYDPYSPTKNEAMWSLEHFTSLRQRLSRPAVLTSYSRSTAVRVTLLLAGFHVGIGSATGEKDQTSVAATEVGLLENPLQLDWLKRVRMSTSARPLGSAEKGPISSADLRTLEAHPQFAIS